MRFPMRKILALLVFVLILTMVTSACHIKRDNNSMVKAERRFAKYVEPPKQTNSQYIDLSEGPKLRYDASLGPQNLSFDFKIVDPY